MSPSYDEGYKAFLDGKKLSDNPYLDHWCPYKGPNWKRGWNDARRDAKEEDKQDRK